METQESGIPEKVSKMAIGVEGGFSSDIKKDEYDDFNEIVVIKGPDSWKSFPIGNKAATKYIIRVSMIYLKLVNIFKMNPFFVQITQTYLWQSK